MENQQKERKHHFKLKGCVCTAEDLELFKNSVIISLAWFLLSWQNLLILDGFAVRMKISRLSLCENGFPLVFANFEKKVLSR
jgi:hypothetical protein